MSIAVADPIARIASLKNCPVCSSQGTSVPVSADEIACARCGFVVHQPPHTDWPAAVKWFAVWEFARVHRFQLRPEQQAWELLVRDLVNGTRAGSSHPNPFLPLTMSSSIQQCLPVVIPWALSWRSAGAPMEPTQFPYPKSA